MKHLLTFILPILILCSCKSQKLDKNQAAFHKEYPNFVSDFENHVTNIFKENPIAGDFIFAVVNENGLAYSFAINPNILAGTPSTLNNDSPIYIASHTKSLTGTLLKMLEAQNKIDLDKSLADYLPELHYQDSIDTKTISIKSLLNHTHGTNSLKFQIKTAYLGYDPSSNELIDDLNNEFKDGRNKKHFMYDSKQKFRYSNMGPILAAMVAEKTIGTSWKAQLKTQIFEPLDMKNTSCNISDFNFTTIRPSIKASKTQGIVNNGFYKTDATMHAAGGTLSTINDLSKWLSANIRQDERLLNKEAWKEMHEATTKQNRKFFTYKRNGYSLGWDIAKYQDQTILTRFGGYAGIAFHISFMPEKNIGIIAFSNDSRTTTLPHLMANYAYNHLNALPETEKIYATEKKLFDDRFTKKNNTAYFKNMQLLPINLENNKMIGTYINTNNWPEIRIEKKDKDYTIYWGLLSGKLYKKANGDYYSDLGALTRSFKIKDGKILTGSLKYTKTSRN